MLQHIYGISGEQIDEHAGRRAYLPKLASKQLWSDISGKSLGIN